MELSLNQISKMRPKDIYLALLSTFSSIYESYAFVNIKEEQYMTLKINILMNYLILNLLQKNCKKHYQK